MIRLKIILILVYLFFCQSLYTQEKWALLNPKPTSDRGKDICFVSDTHGFIITSNELLETNDGGITWNIKRGLLNANCITFYNSLGFIVGDNGFVMRSEDAGLSWRKVETDNDDDYNSIHIIPNSGVIISGYNSIVKSENGYANWQKFDIVGGRAVKTHFFSYGLGHAVCLHGTILKTTNGGESWYVTESTTSFPSDFFTVCFLNEEIGFASQEHSELYKTTDGGETWVEQDESMEAIYRFHFINDEVGFACGDHGAIYKTLDGGSNWDYSGFQNSFRYNTSMYGIYFQDENIGYSVGARGRIVKTEDGGDSWTQYSPTYDDISKIQFVSDKVAYVSLYNSFYKTIDAGETWFFIAYPMSESSFAIRDFDFVNELTGYCIYEHSVYKTIDGGITWNKTHNVVNSNSATLYSIDFITEDMGLLNGKYKTVNGGIIWYTTENATSGKVQFVTEKVTYACNIRHSNGKLYKSIDGGESWDESIEVEEEIRALHFVDEDYGYFVGDQGLMYKTNNGGDSWIELDPPYAYYEDVKFYSRRLGYILDDDGRIYRTIDGGMHWEHIKTHYGTNSIQLFGNKLFAAGLNGKIFRSDLGPLSVENNFIDDYLILFPNPANNYVTIKGKVGEVVEIYSLSGNLILTQTILNEAEIIDIRDFTSSIYLIKIGNETRKLIVE